ncbi:MAG: hypothetical protein N3B16_12265 [Candidatus Aminicenantes bacterium]|nr:hypothetical protein [Candidatus Aminicenantes bacterium]
MGMVACFSPEGDVHFLIETIDRTQPPETIISKGVIFLDPSSPWTCGGISLGESRFYLLSLVGSRKKAGSVIDVYSCFDGRCLYSFEIPAKFLSIYVKEP